MAAAGDSTGAGAVFLVGRAGAAKVADAIHRGASAVLADGRDLARKLKASRVLHN